jgi:hypothetical protein
MTTVIVCGSRSFDDYALLSAKLDKMLGHIDPRTLTVVLGGAKGADALAQKWALSKVGRTAKIERPDYAKYAPKVAPLKRNEKMVDDFGATHLIAFWDGESAGTAHIIGYARKRGLGVRIVRFDWQEEDKGV